MQVSSNLYAATAKKSGVSQEKVKEVVTAFFEEFRSALVAGEKIRIPEIGTFEIQERPERVGRNPATGAQIQIPASKTIKLKVTARVRDSL